MPVVGPRPAAPVVVNPNAKPRGTAPASPPSATPLKADSFEPAPPPPPTSLPASLNLDPSQLRQMVDTVGVSVSTRAATTLADAPQGSLTAAAGTRLSANVSGHSVYLSAEPPLTFDPKPGPAFKIRSISYDFEQAKFSVDAEGVGPDFLYSKVASWAATHYLKPLLPAAIQQPGYDPRTDPNLLSTLQGIATGGGASPTGLADSFERPTLYASFRTGDEIKMPVSDGKAELTVPAGSMFDLTAEMTGPATHPEIADVQLRAQGGHGITVAQTQGLGAGIAGLEIQQARLERGGKITLDYELIPEQLAQGGYALLALFGAMAGDPSLLNKPLPDMRMEGLRKDVDARIQSEVGPQVLELVRQHDGIIPGFSLTEALGL